MQYLYDWRVYWHQEPISMTAAYPISIPYSWFHHMPTLLVFSQVAEESDLFNIPDLLLVFFNSVGQITMLEPRCCLFERSFLQVWCDNGINWRAQLMMFTLHDLIFWVKAWYVKEPKPSRLSYPSIIFLLKLRFRGCTPFSDTQMPKCSVPRRHWTCSAPEDIFPWKWRTIKASYFQTNPFEEILHAGSSGIFHNYHDIPSVGWCAKVHG